MPPPAPRTTRTPTSRKLDPATNNQLLRIAGIGALLAEGDRPATRDEAAKVESELTTIRKRLDAARQVLFVIDDTVSMGPQFPRVARTVRRIIDDASRDPRQTIQVGVSYYNDIQGGRPPGYQTMKLVDARSPAGKALLNEVATHGQRLCDGGDFPEMVMDGLTHALDDARFEAQSNAGRLVVLIGDLQRPGHARLRVDREEIPQGRRGANPLRRRAGDRPREAPTLQRAKLAAQARREPPARFRDQMGALVKAATTPPRPAATPRARLHPAGRRGDEPHRPARQGIRRDEAPKSRTSAQSIARMQARNYPATARPRGATARPPRGAGRAFKPWPACGSARKARLAAVKPPWATNPASRKPGSKPCSAAPRRPA
ncbi:MAG: hypothetical protein U0800_06855 [Isosphaeraceae bacterium]